MNRRRFLQGSAAGVAGLTCAPWLWAGEAAGFIVGACRLNGDQYGLSKVSLAGDLIWQAELPARGHAVELNEAQGIGAAVARRPGQFIVIFDLISGHKLVEMTVPEHFKLNGHSQWLSDSRLVVSGADRVSSESRLLIYDWHASSKQLSLAEVIESPLIGVHEIKVAGGDLWAAIGGLKTQGRDVLNKTDFESGLLKMNRNSLKVEQFYPSPIDGVSLRHFDVTETGPVIGGQYQLDVSQSPVLLFHLQNSSLVPVEGYDHLWPKLSGYIGTVKVKGDELYISSPRSHWLGVFNRHDFKLIKQRLSADVCPLADTPAGIIAGTGTGQLMSSRSSVNSGVIWDNHFAFSAV